MFFVRLYFNWSSSTDEFASFFLASQVPDGWFPNPQLYKWGFCTIFWIILMIFIQCVQYKEFFLNTQYNLHFLLNIKVWNFFNQPNQKKPRKSNWCQKLQLFWYKIFLPIIPLLLRKLLNHIDHWHWHQHHSKYPQ